QDVTVSTGTYPSTGGGDTQSITVASAIAVGGLTASHTLLLEAAGSIDVQANISNTTNNGSALNVNLQANSGATGTLAPIPATGSGALTIESGVTISTGGGTFTGTGVSFNNLGTVNTSGTPLAPNAGAINVSSTAPFGAFTGGTLIANASGNGNAGAITLNADNSIAFTSISSLAPGSGSGGVVSITSNGYLGNGDSSLIQISPGGSLALSAPFEINLTNPANLIPSLSVNSTEGSISITSASSVFDVTSVSTPGDITLSSSAATFSIGSATAGGSIALSDTSAGGQLRILGALNADTNNNGTGLNITLQADRLYLAPGASLSANGPTTGGDHQFGINAIDYVEVIPFTQNLPIVMTGQSYAAIPAGAFAGELVLGGEFFANIATPLIQIGSIATAPSRIALSQSAGSGTIAIPAGTILSLTGQTITQDAATKLSVDVLDVNASSATLTAANTGTAGNNQITLTGTALTDGGSLAVGAAAGQSLVVGTDFQNTGLTGYGTVKFQAPLTVVQTSVTGPDSGSLSVSSTGALSVGDVAGTQAATITNAGDISVSTAGNLVVQGGTATGASASISSTGGNTTINAGGAVILSGGSGTGASAVLDPGNLTLTAAALTLNGGGGQNAFAALEASGNILLTIAGALTLNGGAGANSDAVILSTGGTATYEAGSCVNCTTLATGGVLTNAVTDVGFFPQAIVIIPPPPPPPPAPAPAESVQTLQNIDIASILANEDNTIQDVPITDAPQGNINSTVWVIDARDCGGGQ
ncbi:MAG: hypothetical protein ABSF50_21640, partial [Burkholderiaceae bacterium]